jgi:hypothetical protein
MDYEMWVSRSRKYLKDWNVSEAKKVYASVNASEETFTTYYILYIFYMDFFLRCLIK